MNKRFAAAMSVAENTAARAPRTTVTDQQPEVKRMTSIHETFRSLEQQESGEISRLRCRSCGARTFHSRQQLQRHETNCIEAAARDDKRKD